MEYEKMLCWVIEQEKQTLINENRNEINNEYT